MKTIGSLLVIIFLIMLGLVLGTAVILAWSLGLGWLLMQILPLTWFESALLTMLASITVAYVGWRLLQLMSPMETELGDNGTLFESPIPVERFKENENDHRAEVWFRHEVANDIYWEFEETPSVDESMGETAMKELAIRTTDIVVEMLKARTSHPQRIKITKAQFKRQMNKMEQRPYDDDILLAVVRAVNECLSFDERLVAIVRDDRWGETETGW